MKNITTKQIVTVDIVFPLLAICFFIFLNSCKRGKDANTLVEERPTPQEEKFLSIFKTLYTRDSTFYPAFNEAFTQAYGADSLQRYNENRGLPQLYVTTFYEVSGFRKGEFIVSQGSNLRVTGVLLGTVQINGGKVQNDGFIVGNVVNQGGEYSGNGLLQGALMTKPMHK